MSFDQVYLNGRVIPSDQATISVSDAGFLHGASAFTTMLAHHGKVFRLDRHLDRLLDTVRMLGLRADVTQDALAAATNELLRAGGEALPDAKVRITVTPGSIQGGPCTVLITAEPLPEYYKQWREKGITVVVASLKQGAGDPTYGYKTGCYLPRILAFREAAAKGAQEALWYTPDNRLAEACFRNVFLVLNGKVLTPPRDTPCLPGIVREAVLELCGQMEMPCDAETPLTVREMLAAHEVFLTGSGIGVCPVVRIERHAVGDEKPGEVTKKIMSAYQELLDRECGGREAASPADRSTVPSSHGISKGSDNEGI